MRKMQAHTFNHTLVLKTNLSLPVGSVMYGRGDPLPTQLSKNARRHCGALWAFCKKMLLHDINGVATIYHVNNSALAVEYDLFNCVNNSRVIMRIKVFFYWRTFTGCLKITWWCEVQSRLNLWLNKSVNISHLIA